MTDLRDAMRQAATRNTLVAVDVPEWEQKVYVKQLAVRDQLEMEGDPQTVALKTLLRSIVDENGDRLLSDDDYDLLTDQPLAVVIPLLTVAGQQNGIDVGEAVQAFKVAQSEDSSSD